MVLGSAAKRAAESTDGEGPRTPSKRPRGGSSSIGQSDGTATPTIRRTTVHRFKSNKGKFSVRSQVLQFSTPGTGGRKMDLRAVASTPSSSRPSTPISRPERSKGRILDSSGRPTDIKGIDAVNGKAQNDVLPAPQFAPVTTSQHDEPSAALPGEDLGAGYADMGILAKSALAVAKVGQRAKTAVYSMLGWRLYKREPTLLEAVRLDALPEPNEACTHCKGPLGTPKTGPDAETGTTQAAATSGGAAQSESVGNCGGFRCDDCRFGLFCKGCVAEVHKYTPFHNIERANGNFWERIHHQEEAGIEIQLMHSAGERCIARDTVRNFSVMHTNGSHKVTVHFCRCSRGLLVDRYTQLFRARLWPSTVSEPVTATTFECLDQFSRLSMLGRLSGYDYYKALMAATDAFGLLQLPSLLKQFMRSARQFRHIFLFKRAGSAHDGNGIEGTPAGGCAIECLACPRPGVNIPDDWRTRPFQWLYRRYLSIDANFRLSNRFSRSTEKTDPSLNDGRAYVVPQQEFSQYLAKVERDADGNEAEKASTCSRFGALEQQNQKGGRGLRTTGVAGCFCGRHDTWLPLSLAQLTKGERYSVMDYIVNCVHSWLGIDTIVYSYDIACQWHVNHESRVKKVASTFKIVYAGAAALLSKARIYVVPKFHLFAHKIWCFLRFNFSYTPGVAQTDGEGCERVWSSLNPAASSLREMGPGSMRDTLDDICSSWNFQKACGIGQLLFDRMKEALPHAVIHSEIYTDFTAALRADSPDILQAYEEKMEKWEANGQKGADCPYELNIADLSLAQLSLGAEQPSSGAQIGGEVDEELEDALRWLTLGLKIEEMRSRLKAGLDDDGDGEGLSGGEAVLAAAFSRFRAEQEHMMQALYVTLGNDERIPKDEDAHKLKLYLPSDFDDKVKDLRVKFSQLAALEKRLREVFMHAALEELRQMLRLRVALNKFKIANYTGQKKNTRARTAQATVDKRVVAAANSYRRHWNAYGRLHGWQGDTKKAQKDVDASNVKGTKEGNKEETKESADVWKKQWRELKPEDCIGLGDRAIAKLESMEVAEAQEFLRKRGIEKKKGPKLSSGQSKAKVSWIWYNREHGEDIADGLDVTDDLMVEWCKARARAQRWAEQVKLLAAEQEQTVLADLSDAAEWERKAALPFVPRRSKNLPHGWKDPLTAYDNDEVLIRGLRAYALKQAHYRRVRSAHNDDLRLRQDADVQAFWKTHTLDGRYYEGAAS